jgi:molybdate transport system substrate-binding protein
MAEDFGTRNERRQVGTILTRRAILTLGLLLAVLGIPSVGTASGDVLAQGLGITCESAATPVASPSVGAAAASPVALEGTFPTGGGQLTVFAAASLTDAFGKMKTDLEAAHPGLSITYNFAGSQTLVTQLKEGAQADVFASADTKQMSAAIANGSISGSPVTFVHNRLVIVTPKDNPAGIASAADLAKLGLRLVLAQAEVPVGRYARQAICDMATDTTTYGEAFADHVGGNIVSEEENVRDVLAKVQLGEADAGIVYVSDAASAGDDVQRIDIPDAVNVVATYPIAAVNGGNQALADAFIAYVLGPDGQATLADFGFEPVS